MANRGFVAADLTASMLKYAFWDCFKHKLIIKDKDRDSQLSFSRIQNIFTVDFFSSMRRGLCGCNITLTHLHNLCLSQIIISRATSLPVTSVPAVYILSGFEKVNIKTITCEIDSGFFRGS